MTGGWFDVHASVNIPMFSLLVSQKKILVYHCPIRKFNYLYKKQNQFTFELELFIISVQSLFIHHHFSDVCQNMIYQFISKPDSWFWPLLKTSVNYSAEWLNIKSRAPKWTHLIGFIIFQDGSSIINYN